MTAALIVIALVLVALGWSWRRQARRKALDEVWGETPPDDPNTDVSSNTD